MEIEIISGNLGKNPVARKKFITWSNLKQIIVLQLNQNGEKIDLQQIQKKLTLQPKYQPLIPQYKKNIKK